MTVSRLQQGGIRRSGHECLIWKLTIMTQIGRVIPEERIGILHDYFTDDLEFC